MRASPTSWPTCGRCPGSDPGPSTTGDRARTTAGRPGSGPLRPLVGQTPTPEMARAGLAASGSGLDSRRLHHRRNPNHLPGRLGPEVVRATPGRRARSGPRSKADRSGRGPAPGGSLRARAAAEAPNGPSSAPAPHASRPAAPRHPARPPSRGPGTSSRASIGVRASAAAT